MPLPDHFPVLTSERLVLREMADRDLDALFEMESDPIAMRYWSKLPVRELDEARATLERAKRTLADRVGIRWSITRREEDSMLGLVSMFEFSEQNRRAEIGYGLLRRHWGQGYMHEALIAVIGYAFGPLGLHRLEADIHPGNAASLRALERLGFAREGHLRERWHVGEEISDSVLLGLLAAQWRAGGAGR